MNRKLNVVISGSFRKHLSEIGIAISNFKKIGLNVLAPNTHITTDKHKDFILLQSDDMRKSADVLESDFLKQIKRSDFLYVANVDGYIGLSACTEIGFALINGISVVVAEKIKEFPPEISSEVKSVIKRQNYVQLSISKINTDKIENLKLGAHKKVNLRTDEMKLMRHQVKTLLNNLKSVNIQVMSNLKLKQNPTLHDYQEYIKEMVKERGFDKEKLPEIFMLFLEECGEMAKAARKAQNIKTDKNSQSYNVDHEVADVFIYLLDICNQLGVDLEKAFREKEEINKKRTWS